MSEVATPPAPPTAPPAPPTGTQTPPAQPPTPPTPPGPGGAGQPPQTVPPPPAPPSTTPPAPPPPASTKTGILGDGDAIEAVNEKFHVKKEDGTVDRDATMRKLATSYSELEKRVGRPDVRPKDSEGYVVPESAKAFIAPDDVEFGQFRRDAFKAGMSQSQMDLVLGQWAKIAPRLVDGALTLKATEAEAALRKTWGDEFDENLGHSDRAIAQLAGGDAEILAAVRNNPPLIRLLAKVGAQLREDTSPTHDLGTGGGEDINMLLAHPAYGDPKHVEHASVTAKIKAHYDRMPGANRPIA